MKVSRMDGGSTYRCEGFLNNEFINRSARLDNLLLDGMEPFDYSEMKELDFAYVAGHCVRISDIADKELKERADREAVFATILFSAMVFGAFMLFGMGTEGALLITGALAAFFIIVTLCVYSETKKNKLIVGAGRNIFTSGENVYQRHNGRPEPHTMSSERETVPPVFFSKVDGLWQPVRLKFATPGRIILMLLLSAVVLFLPVIIALFLNGFDFRGIHLGGSAVWFCIMVPVVPIYVLKPGIVDLYEKPWIYIKTGNGKKYRRYRVKPNPGDIRDCIKTVLRVLIIPPLCFGVWLAVICFCVICYLTAFG